MSVEQKWPDQIWVVRHGQSAANVARDVAEADDRSVIGITARDADVPLSDLGKRQAAALGCWFGQMPAEERPSVVLASPFVRAHDTADGIIEAAGLDRNELAFVVDERLREKEFGILEGLTKRGIREKLPEEHARREIWGKFYYRPPGGESWADVILRLRMLLETITREYRRERVLIVCHSVVVQCFRYLFERMSEKQILEIDRAIDVANCSVTSYRFDPACGKHGKLVRDLTYFVAPLDAAGAEVTTAPDGLLALNK